MASKIGSKLKSVAKKVVSKLSKPAQSPGSQFSAPKAVTKTKEAVKSYASGVAQRATSAPVSPGSNLKQSGIAQRASSGVIGGTNTPLARPVSSSKIPAIQNAQSNANRIKGLFPGATPPKIPAPTGETQKLTPPEAPVAKDYTGTYTGASQTQVNPDLGITAKEDGTLQVKPPAPVAPTQPETSTFDSLMEKAGLSIPKKENVEGMIQGSEAQKQYEQARQEVQTYSNQINQIVAKAEADKLSLIGQGRGIPEVIIGGQQAQISREAAIQSMPIQALLSNAQGNLEVAKDHLDSWSRLIKEEATNQFEYESKVFDTAMSYATKQEERQFQELKTASDRRYNETIKLADKKSELMASALQQGAPASIYNAIKNAGTYDDAIIAAGRYGMSALESAQLANINSQIAERNNAGAIGSAYGVDEKTMGKLQVAPEYKTISGVLPAIQTIKRYEDAIKKWGSYENLSGTGKGELRQAYGDALSAWKSLATLGALSGADFALAENVIPEPGLFTRNSVALSKLGGGLQNAVSQTQFLTNRLSKNYPTAGNLLGSQLDDILVISNPDKYKYGEDGLVYEITD